MKTRKKNRMYSLSCPRLWPWLLLLGLTAGGCVKDNPSSAGTKAEETDGPVPVTIRLITRFGQTGKGAPSRGLDESAEDLVNDVYVFFLRASDNRVHSVVEGKDVTNAGTADKTFTANLEVAGNTGEEFRCVVLANAGSLLHGQNLDLYKGKTYAELQQELTSSEYTAAPVLAGGDFAMWGEAEETVHATHQPQKITINMLRALARLDIGLGIDADKWNGKDNAGNDIPFRLKKVFIFKPQSRYSFLPLADAYDATGQQVTKPSPAGEAVGTPFSYDVPDGATSLTASIYLPEADVRQGADAESGDAHHTNRCAIVVGGSYKNHADTYYRIDFRNGKQLTDLLRNHRYLASISSVSSDGADTPEGAYKNQSVGITANVLSWNDWSQSVIFDGVDHVYVAHKDILLPGNSGQAGTIWVESNVEPADWQMSLDGAPLSTNNPIATADFEVTKPADKEGDLLIKTRTRLADGAAAKTATLRVKIHRLEFTISIRQLPDTPEDWVEGGDIPKDL